MNQFLRFALRSLHLLGLRPATRYVRTSANILRFGYLPIMVTGLIGAGYFQEGWPLWLSIPCGGLLWFVVEGRIMAVAMALQFIPKHKFRETELKVPDALSPSKVSNLLSTIGMWALVTSFFAAVFQIYRPVHVPMIGLINFYTPFLSVLTLVMFIVATSEPDVKYWRKMLGRGLAAVGIGMIGLMLVSRFAYGSSLYLVTAWFRADTHKEVQSNYEEGVDQVEVKSLNQVNAELIALRGQQLSWQHDHLDGSPFPRQAEQDHLVALKDEVEKKQKEKTEEEPSRSMTSYLHLRLALPVGILLLVVGAISLQWVKE